ncbi:MAG TPA: hypothetical protein VKT49_16600 [Bryobacteraceae bacterium]|nr:hypothetical protein [Bryobacteraceae bacterium]
MPRRGNSLSECLFAFVELAIGSYFGYVALSTSNHWYVDSREISQFVLRPSRIIFFMPPCMACLGLVVLFHDRIKSGLFKRVLKREIPDSWQSPLLEGFFRKAFVVWTVVLSALSVSLIPVHTRFTGEHLVAQALWPMPERRHSYSDVKSVALAYYYSAPSAHSRGGWSKERALYLRFRDGAIWTTMNGLAEAHPAEREAIADFVSRLSGVPVEYPELGDTRCCSTRPPR